MLLLIIIVALSFALCLIGYNCGGQGFNITLSLLDVGESDMNDIELLKEKTYMQLMQLLNFDKIPAIQLGRTINYCDMHSHISIVHNGKKEYLQKIRERACKGLHESGSFSIANADKIIMNA